MSVAPFIDWIDLYQRHGVDSIPEVGGGRQLRADMALEVPESETVRPLMREGSHSTKVRVWSDGTASSISGNVGRYNRPDNVWNLDWLDTLAAANRIAAEYGLPEFSSGTHYVKDSVSAHDQQRGLFDGWTGARVSVLHVTKNYAAGSSELARDVLRYFQGQRLARVSKGRLGATTLVFGSGKSQKQVEVYLKADELLAHARGEEAKRKVRESDLYKYCRDVGLVRVECKWKRGFLRDRGANFVGGLNMGKVISLFNAETSFLHDAAPDRIARLADQLPKKMRVYALCWLRGDDVRDLLGRTRFYIVAKALREFGIDICEPRARADDANVELDRLLAGIPRFELKPLAMPEWYECEQQRFAA